MKYPSPFCFLFATLVCLTRAQDSNDGCITCYLGDLFGDYILPAAGRLFAPDLPSNPGAINPAPGLVEPQTDPEEQRSTDNVPSVTDQTDIELGIIGEPNPKCDPNAAGAKACAVGTAQIVWPSPFPCGDQVGTSKILASLNQLAPPGGVRSFHNKCGTWFFTASLTPQQIEQLMGENVGIEFIEPDQDATDDVESLSNFFGKRSLPKFEKLDRKSVARPWRMKKRVRIEPDFIRMTPDAPLHLAYISTPPGFANPDNVYASYHSDGKMVHVYWIGNNFHPQNADLGGYITAQHELRAEDIDLMEDDYDPRQPDIVGCLLSIVGGDMFGVLHGVDERLRDEQFEMEPTNGLQLGFVKVHLRASSFLSGFQTILTELERRAASGDLFVHAYTVIGTSISIRDSRPSLQRRAAELIERLIQFGVVIVVAEGNELHPNRRRPSEDPNDGWPASFAFNPETPLILASGVSISNGIDMSPTPSPRQLLRAPWDATCMNGERVARIRGTPASAAIIVGLAADMLSREKVRTKLHLDFPDLEPEPERLLNLPVSAKIRNYLDEKSHDQRGSQPGIRSVWNGLDPRDPNIENYEA